MDTIEYLRGLEAAATAGPWDVDASDDGSRELVGVAPVIITCDYDHGEGDVENLCIAGFAEGLPECGQERENAYLVTTARNVFSALLDVAEAAAPHLNAYDGPCSPDEAEVCGYDGYMCQAEREWTLARHRALADALAALDAAVARERGSDE